MGGDTTTTARPPAVLKLPLLEAFGFVLIVLVFLVNNGQRGGEVSYEEHQVGAATHQDLDTHTHTVMSADLMYIFCLGLSLLNYFIYIICY